MSSDLETLLHRVAPEEAGPAPVGDIVRRARRRRLRLGVTAAGIAVIGMVGGQQAMSAFDRSSPDPAAPSPLRIREGARIQVDGSPVVLAFGEGATWVATDNGVLHRIDPSSNDVVASVQLLENTIQSGRLIDENGADAGPAPQRPPQRFATISTGQGAVWVSASSAARGCRIFKVDPDTNEVAAEASVPGCSPMTAAAGALWVGVAADDGSPGKLLALDPASLEIGREVKTGPCCMSGIAETGGYLWLGRQDISNTPQDPAAEHEDMVLDMALDVLQIDPSSLSVINEVPLDGDTYHPGDTLLSEAIAPDAQGVWLTRPEAGVLVHVDTARLVVDKNVEVHQLRMPDNPVVGEEWIAVSDLNGTSIALIDRQSGEVVDVYDTNSLLAGDAGTNGNSLWVAQPDKNRVVRLEVE